MADLFRIQGIRMLIVKSYSAFDHKNGMSTLFRYTVLVFRILILCHTTHVEC